MPVSLRNFVSVAAAAWLLLPSVAAADTSHKTAQDGPIMLGTSGSTDALLVMDGVSYCFAGTLGGAVIDANLDLFILSNNHVLAQTNSISLGEAIIQPALLDGDCPSNGNALNVGHLSDFVHIDFCKAAGPLGLRCKNNTVDAAIALVMPGTVATDGYILDIGPTGSTPASATLGMSVQKSGRTTGHTTGTVAAVDVSVLVCYANPCDDAGNLAHFVNQVRVDGGGFSAGGDSGSLIVECTNDGASGCDAFPAPVGLLFAGGSTSTFFNRFEDVQSAFGVAPVGCDATCFGDGDGGGGGGGGPGGNGPPGRNRSVFGTGLELASEVRASYADELLQRRGVQGTGISVDEFGDPVIEVYVRDAIGEADNPIPSDLEGIPVRVIETGQIRAF